VIFSEDTEAISPMTTSLTPRSFFWLLFIACVMGANHVAARFALDHGADVVTAVSSRSLVTAMAVAFIVKFYGVPTQMNPRQRKFVLAIGALVAAQSVLLYSSVARIPVGLALLAFNTYPLCTALWAAVLYRHRPNRSVLLAMPVILLGLALALDVSSTSADSMGLGVTLAQAASLVFGLVLVLTQHEVAELDGRLRTTVSMSVVGVLALCAGLAQGGLHWPHDAVGWTGLTALTLLYGSGITLVFVLLPKLGVVGNSPILNVEPVAALLMAWGLLGQAMRPIQWVGALLVVATVMALGLRRR
jgi:drug/metabolite transporter (DMT)-like permease